MNSGHIFCWHHCGLTRLKDLLSRGLIDCPGEDFLSKHGLKPGDDCRVSIKVPNVGRGDIVAIIRLVSERPFPLHPPKHPGFPFAVRVDKIRYVAGGYCPNYPYATPPPLNPSGWGHLGNEGHIVTVPPPKPLQ